MSYLDYRYGFRNLRPTNVQDWKPPQERYRSEYEYRCDSAVNRKMAGIWDTKKEEITYSSSNKSFYSTAPNNSQTDIHAPVMGRFDYTRLAQTDVLPFIYSHNIPSSRYGEVSLGCTIAPLVQKMGTMYDCATGENLGTCTLIAHNLVLVARHTVEGRPIQNIRATFGYTQFGDRFFESGSARFHLVMEQDPVCDYAIIQLKEPLGKHLGFVSLNIEEGIVAEPALLHYPLRKPLKVSVHTFVQNHYETEYLLAYHDSDYYSSGSAYFNPKGCMIALHLGSEILQGETMNLLRYALPLAKIVRRNPYSLLGKFGRGEEPQNKSYFAYAYWLYLDPTDHVYLIDEEGRESEKVLRALLTNELQTDNKIKRNPNGTILFSKTNLQYIASTYPTKYNIFRDNCLKQSGLHAKTRQYSVNRLIESDHTIPYNVWKSTTHPTMNDVVTAGGGNRAGENEMPAITIPWEIHRKLLTTGGVTGYRAFHQTLIDLCDADKIDEALILCYEEYQNKGLVLNDYKEAIEKSLYKHIELGLISKSQKRKIVKTVF